MPKTVGIIGGLGVGRAHVIAAMKNRCKVAWVLEVEDLVGEARLAFSPPHVVNEWHDIRYSMDLDYAIPIITSLDQASTVDMVVIAVPNEHHQYYLDRVGSVTGRVLCEKPLMGMPATGYRLSTNFSWLHHPSIKEILVNESKIYSITIGHPHVQDRDVVEDLGSHALAILFARYPGSQLNWVSPTEGGNGAIATWTSQHVVEGMDLGQVRTQVRMEYKAVGKGKASMLVNGVPLFWREESFAEAQWHALFEVKDDRKERQLAIQVDGAVLSIQQILSTHPYNVGRSS